MASRFWRLKYALEWLAGSVGLLCILPLLAVLALLVKVTSPGPVFYKSERLGRNGRVFRLYKFRSMRVGVAPVLGPDGKVLTLDNDPRWTPLGRFLRLGFDELPQLINVVRGEMCLIGPRPDIPSELERYTNRERHRLHALPGITGLAQVVNGRQFSNAVNYELDVLYTQHSSFVMDLGILAVTLPYSFGLAAIGQRLFRRYLETAQRAEEGRAVA
jgi:lipopolysaccharide/colanic/teichoic acid biosynthesis glycosyltransferase